LNASFVIALNPFCLRVSINYRRRRVGVLIVLKAKHTRPTERVFTYTHHRACSTINYTFIYARVHAQQVPIYIRTCRERGYVHTQRTSIGTLVRRCGSWSRFAAISGYSSALQLSSLTLIPCQPAGAAAATHLFVPFFSGALVALARELLSGRVGDRKRHNSD